MEAPIIIGIVSDGVSGLSVTSGSLVVNRSVRSKNVVSISSVQDILIIYSEVELTSILEFSDKVREASENEYKLQNEKQTKDTTVTEQF